MRFDSYHPMINMIFFTAAIAFTVMFRQPVFLAISYATSFIYSVKLNGRRVLVFNIILIPLIALYALFYASYNHFGVTNIGETVIGNMITLESLVFGFVIGVIIASVAMWFSCVHAIVSTDKITFILGRITPRLSLFFSIILRTVPRLKDRARKINTAQRAIGRGVDQGRWFCRAANLARLLSILTTWMMENFIESSDSMKSRGYTLKGRTAFSIYRFDNRDRSFVIVLFFAVTVLLAGFALDQTKTLYDPQIIINPITPMSYMFYTAYAFFCLLPMILQMVGEKKFARLQKRDCPK